MTPAEQWAVLKRGKVITVIRGEGAESLARAVGDGVPGYSVEWRPDDDCPQGSLF